MGLLSTAAALAVALVGVFLQPAVGFGTKVGVCYKKVQYVRLQTEGDYVSQIRVYYERCGLRRCSKYRTYWQYRTSTKPVTTYRTESECCPGYARASEFHDCEPVCLDGCKEREDCVAPGKCVCREGYLPNPSSNTCLSPCEVRGCEHGSCTDLNTCTCDIGYRDDVGNGRCEPVCKRGCGANAECFAPDQCRCLDGFGDLDSKGCKPMCKLKLKGALCVDTERYKCLPGYVFDKQATAEYLCRPTCIDGCQNGECVAPETCSCLEGYERVNSTTCAPICEHVCSNGECVAPDTCRCYEGYELDPQDDTNSTCEPTCHATCIGGACTAPDTCTCNDGYDGPVLAVSNSSYDSEDLDINTTGLAATFNNTCVPVCSRGCQNGFCVVPETCSCLEGYDIDPSDETNSTCTLVSQSLALCDGDECPDSGEAAPVAAVAAGAGVGAVLLLAAVLLAALYWARRRRGTKGAGNFTNPSYNSGSCSSASGVQLLEESCVDEEGIEADNDF